MKDASLLRNTSREDMELSDDQLTIARQKLVPHLPAVVSALGKEYEKDPRYKRMLRQAAEGKRTIAYIVADILDP